MSQPPAAERPKFYASCIDRLTIGAAGATHLQSFPVTLSQSQEGEPAMNARPLVKLFVIALLLTPVCVAAQVFQFDPLPDLAPVDITLGTNCRISVTLTNYGPGIVPSSGY